MKFVGYFIVKAFVVQMKMSSANPNSWFVETIGWVFMTWSIQFKSGQNNHPPCTSLVLQA